MRRQPSLVFRLAIAIIAMQSIVVVGWLLIWMLFSEHVSYEDMSAATAQRAVAQSIGRDEAGRLRITPNRALLEYARDRPKLVYAAYVRGHLVDGSSKALADAVAARGPTLTIGNILLGNGKRGHAGIIALEGGGAAVIVTSGNRFGIDDIPSLLRRLLPEFIETLAPAILASVAVLPFMIRRVLAPLRRAAQAASGITLETLDQRLSSADVPREIQPFVVAINQLLERIEREVARAQLLVANAAHELRTPVAILCARMDTLGDETVTRELRSDAQRLSLMVDQLLAASCMQGQSAAQGRRVDLVVLLRELIADLAPLALRGGRMLALESDPSTCVVRGQPDALRSAIGNLIDNAIRAEPEGGTVIVTLTEGDPVVVEVVDHGPGVDPADRESVFEPFWRRDNHWKGTGLGLAIARRIAQAHGGTIVLRETPGGGATFRLSVGNRPDPVSQPQGRSTSIPDATAGTLAVSSARPPEHTSQ